MLMNGNKLRIHVNTALNMDSILLRITSADSVPRRNRDGGWFGRWIVEDFLWAVVILPQLFFARISRVRRHATHSMLAWECVAGLMTSNANEGYEISRVCLFAQKIASDEQRERGIWNIPSRINLRSKFIHLIRARHDKGRMLWKNYQAIYGNIKFPS